MPIYEYQCEDCGQKFEALRHMKDADVQIECKFCHSTHTHRKLSTCYTQSSGRGGSTSSHSCSGCSGGSCSSCGH